MESEAGLLYALVSKGVDVLAERAAANLSGNFTQITRVLLKRIDVANNAKASYVLDGYLFHYMVCNGLIYLCMADESFGRVIPFEFLNDIKIRFVATYGEHTAKSAIAYAFNAEFGRVLELRMDYYNSPRSNTKISAVQDELQQAKHVMVQNIDRVLERGEKIELLVDKTERLDDHGLRFRKRATGLRRSMWWKNAKAILLMAVLVIAIVYVVLAVACGGPTLKQC